MAQYCIEVKNLRAYAHELKCGDSVWLSGIIYTARDAAHLRLYNMLRENKALPFDINDAVIYYAGPTPTKPNGQTGSFGPTTSSRMDVFSPALLNAGLCATIGKGDRGPEVISAIVRNSALYFCAGGGMGALISQSVESVEEIAFFDLGPESIKKLKVKNFPVITAIDAMGNSIFDRKNGGSNVRRKFN